MWIAVWEGEVIVTANGQVRLIQCILYVFGHFKH